MAQGGERDKLLVILMVNTLVTLAEGVGSYFFHSSMLFQNFMVGLSDCLLLLLNVAGLLLEAKGRWKFGRRLATGSDAVLALAFAIDGGYGLHCLYVHPGDSVSADWTLVIAVAAMFIDGLCAWFCSAGMANSASARFKLLIGMSVGAVTALTSAVIRAYHVYWLDPLMTFLVGVAVVITVILVIARRRKMVVCRELLDDTPQFV